VRIDLHNRHPFLWLRIPGVADFDEGPAAPGSGVVDGGHPEGLGGGDFGFFVFVLGSGDFDDQLQRVVGAVAVVDWAMKSGT
jgi:hypothetical protein